MATREELYERIRATSKDEVILDEMIRLGFWPRETGQPQDPQEEIRRRGELQRQLSELASQHTRLSNIETAKKELRARRLKESREKRKQTKLRRLQERQDRAEAWRRRKDREILYLGAGVSAGLNGTEPDEARLKARGLPAFATAEAMAKAMKTTVAQLRFLAFQRTTSTVNHYQRFLIPKKTGGQRLISAPMPRLKAAQHWILANILEKAEVHPAAHGFRRGRSIVSNAEPHVGAEVVVNLDLEQFFPTVTYRRVKGVFRKLGYGEQTAVILASICTEPDTAEVELDGQTYFVAQGERVLPQGSPCSPALTNLICRGLDARLTNAAAAFGFVYTRYADDLSFSGSGPAKDRVGKLLNRVRFVVKDEGFRVHPEKTRVLRRARRQEVTGLVVNQRVNVSRDELRRFRATLFQIERDGPKGKRWGDSPDVLAAVEGFANFVAMVDPKRGRDLQDRARAVARRWRDGSAKPAKPPGQSGLD